MPIHEKLKGILVDFIRVSVTELPLDVIEALKHAYEAEKAPFIKSVYEAYFKNLEVARAERIPLCQDTGLIEFFVKAGTKSPFLDYIEDTLVEAVREATHKVPLRPNAVHPFKNINTGDNTGSRIPFVHVELVPGSADLDIYIYIAGGGSSFPASARSFLPGLGFKAIKNLVIETVANWGMNACPPLMIGIGIAGTLEIAALLSKKALLRKIGERNLDPDVAQLEEELKNELNNLGIGAQGLGGKITVLDVFIEYAHRHPATLFGAVSIGCWANRRGRIVIHPDLSYELPLHRR